MEKNTCKIYLVCRTGASGVADYSLSLIPKLVSKFAVSFITASTALEHPMASNVLIVPIFTRMRYLCWDMLKYISFVMTSRPKILLYQSWIGFPVIDALVIRFFRLIGISCYVTAHDVMPHHSFLLSKLTVGFFFRSFDGVIAHSSKAESYLIQNHHVSAPVLVVPHGLYDVFNLDQLSQQQARARLGGYNDRDFIVLFFGHIDERKGILEFLEAAKSYGNHGKIKFLVAGENNLGNEYKSLLNSDLPDNIRIDVGYIPFDKVQNYFSACNVVALPYREGTTSGVLKIAMAFCKPIIATSVGDIAETMQDWPGVLLSDSNIKDDLISAVSAIHENSDNVGYKLDLAKEKYGWDAIGSKYSDFILRQYKL